MIRGMGQIEHVAHKNIESIFDGEVEISEKVDGSFFSWAIIDGELQMRSKGQELYDDAPSAKMFRPGMEAVKERADLLTPEWIYRGEFLAKPRHNSLAYDRIPTGHVAIFDIEMSMGDHADRHTRGLAASAAGFEPVQVLWTGEWTEGVSGLKSLLDTDSMLGGQKIEGVVVKNFGRPLHGHVLMGKLVSDAFKEVHSQEWKRNNPSRGDVVDQLIDKYRSEARWNKAIQHLREDGILTNSPRDIGPLLKEVGLDVLKEEEQEIKDALFKLCWPKIQRGIAAGLPDWYKHKLESEET